VGLACGLQPPQQGAPAAPQTPQANPTALPPAGYVLAWSDEFDGAALDARRWTAMTGARQDAVMTAANAQVRDGLLTLTSSTDAGVHHTAFLTTQGKYLTTYGYFEARIMFNDSPGEWCAFWINSPTNGKPLGDPGTAGTEIDVVEHRVTDQGGWTALRDMVALNLNWDGYGPDKKNDQRVLALPGGGAVQGAWRTYGVLWTRSSYTFYVDGNALWTSTDAISHAPESIQLTCEVDDGGWAGSVPPGGYGPRSSSTTRMLVDWVRVWQLPGQ
jgi:beta-glucanase (GH16 family)